MPSLIYELNEWAANWKPTLDFFVAVGTISVAAFTGWLARETNALAKGADQEATHTRKLADATMKVAEEARLAREQEQRRLAPILVDVGLALTPGPVVDRGALGRWQRIDATGVILNKGDGAALGIYLSLIYDNAPALRAQHPLRSLRGGEQMDLAEAKIDIRLAEDAEPLTTQTAFERYFSQGWVLRAMYHTVFSDETTTQEFHERKTLVQ